MHDLMKSGRSVASSFSLEAQSSFAGKSPAAPAQVPDATQEAMREQGMSEGGNFSPGEPISPYQQVGTPPIITPYQVGQNIFAVPRGLTGVGFGALTNITSKWDVARLCIEVRQDEIRNLDWDIVVDKDSVDDPNLYDAEIKAAKQFFNHPSPGQDFDDLIMTASDDWLRYDALTIARMRTRNGKLGALEAIDGTSIAPLIDGRGAMPRGEAPAYVQWSWGLPWVWLTERDIIYKPHHPRTQTRYGLPPAEWVLLTANTDLRLQWYFLSYFTEGAVPEAFVNAPPNVEDPKQVKALQDAYDATISGSRGAHHKVKWIPPGSNVHAVNKGNFDVGLAGFLVAKGCASYKVQPAEIGFTEKVNKSSGDTQENVTYRRSIIPTVKYFQSIFNKILREDMNMPYARFKYLDIEEEEDQLKLAQTRSVYIQNAVLSPDEVRKELGYAVDENAPVGRAFAMRTGVIFVDPDSQKFAREQGNVAQQYGIDVSGDDATSEDDEMLSTHQAMSVPVIKPLPAKPVQQQTQQQPSPTQNTKASQDELKKWRAAAVKRSKDGKLAKEWQSNVLDQLLVKVINSQLTASSTPDDVRRVFEPLIGGDAPVNFMKRTIKRGKGRVVVRDTEKLQKHTDALKMHISVLLKREGEQISRYVTKAIQEQGQTYITTEESTTPAVNPTVLDAILASYGWQGWDKHLKSTIDESAKEIFLQGAIEGAKTVGVNLSFDMVNPLAVEYAEKRGAELVGKKKIAGEWVDNPNPKFSIPDATREMVRKHVVAAVKEGQSIQQLQKGIQEHYAFSDSRAQTIARTETGFAYNGGSNAGFRQAQVQHVEVFDGDDDPECAAADGSTWTVDYAEEHALAHPNCVRAFGPIPPDEDRDYVPSTE